MEYSKVNHFKTDERIEEGEGGSRERGKGRAEGNKERSGEGAGRETLQRYVPGDLLPLKKPHLLDSTPAQ